jgi:hypothetical protein
MASQTGPRIFSRIYRIGRLSHPPPPKHGGGRCTGGSGGTAPAICAARDGCTERDAFFLTREHSRMGRPEQICRSRAMEHVLSVLHTEQTCWYAASIFFNISGFVIGILSGRSPYI